MSLYITGVTIRDKSVELINPPISAIASGEIRGLVERGARKYLMHQRHPLA
jgi:hypothetical protein